MPTLYADFDDEDILDAKHLNERIDALSQAITAISDPFPLGAVMPYGAGSPPGAWLLCDGSALLRSLYSDLFALIGTTYGVGDGFSTFNLPDLRGRTPIGAGTGAGLTARTVGQSIGEEAHILTVPELASHTHAVQLAETTTIAAGATSVTLSGSSPTTSAGSDTAHNNMQPSLVTNYIIKAVP